MKKLLITGFSGFVSRHFLNYLFENSIPMDIYGVDITEPPFDIQAFEPKLTIRFRKVNLLDIESLKALFWEFTPDYILHLASFSSVAYSWKHPSESFTNNTNIFLNLISTVSEFNSQCRILSVGSSEEYGNVTEADLPLKESQALAPVSPYGVARVSQELLSRVYVDSYRLNIILTRSFNHIGPNQDERFVIPSFIRRILEIKSQGLKEGTIETGDTSIIRDFVDVRDVVRAYYQLLMRGTSGEVYNICSGSGIALSEMIQQIAGKLKIKVRTRMNPEYVRLSDNKVMIGSPAKIENELGWRPEIPLQQTLSDMINNMKGQGSS